jgi:His-Xaa-Ser repeat protein HxsA
MNWRDRLTLLLGAASPFALQADEAAASPAALPAATTFDPPEAQKDLLVFRDPAERERLLLFAGHRSHSSHSSHRSHSSHYSGSGGHSSHSSHSSHYSSTGGGYTTPLYTPPPVLTRPATPKPRPAAPRVTAPRPAAPSAPASVHPLVDGSSPAAQDDVASSGATALTHRLTRQELKDMITKVQVALYVRGYRPGPIDGQLGALTKAALRKFQTDRALDVTGVMDLETLQALNVEIAMPSAAAPVEPPTSESTPEHQIRAPVWLKRPSGEDLARYYPDRAQRLGVAGEAVIRCTVDTGGVLSNCTVESESPPAYGFGDAAIRLAHLFRLQVKPEDVGATITLPIIFNLPI